MKSSSSLVESGRSECSRSPHGYMSVLANSSKLSIPLCVCGFNLCVWGEKKIKKLKISILSTFFYLYAIGLFFPRFKVILYSLRFSNTLLNIFPPQLKLTLGFLRKAKWVKCVVNPLCLKSGHCKIWVCYITPFCHQLLLCILPLGL